MIYRLHSNSHLKNSGVFVVRARSCVVAGIKASSMNSMMNAPVASSSRGGTPNNVTGSIGTKVSVLAKPNSKVAKDPDIGVTVRITKGPFKGHMAQVVDATADHYSVELLSKMKKISIERSKTVVVGDKAGERNAANRSTPNDITDMITNEKYMVGATPQHFSMQDTPGRAMGLTPSHGGDMTPFGSRTPGRSADDIWSVNAKDGLVAWNEPIISSNEYSRDSSTKANDASSHVASPWSIGDSSNMNSSSIYSTSQAYNQSAISANTPISNAAYSPFGVQASPVPFNSGGDASSNASKDWVTNMVVTFKYGSYTGKNAVIRKLPDEVLYCIVLIACQQKYITDMF